MRTGEIVSFCFEAAAVQLRGDSNRKARFLPFSLSITTSSLTNTHSHSHRHALTQTRTLSLATRLQTATLIKLTKNNAECLKKEEGEELEQQQ